MRKKLLLAVLFISLGTPRLFAQDGWTLQQCIQYAMDKNIALKQLMLQQTNAKIDWNQAKLNLLPSINAGGDYGYNFGQRIDPYTNSFANTRVQSGNVYMSGSIDLFRGFYNQNNIKKTKASFDAAQYDLKDQQNNIALQIGNSFLNVLMTRENLSVNQNQVAITQQQVNRMQKLVDAGQVARGDLYSLQSQLSTEQLNEVKSQNDLDLAYLNLKQLMQLPPEQADSFKVATPDLGDIEGMLLQQRPTDIYNTAQTIMPQVKAAESRVDAAQYSLSSTKGQLYPRLSLSGSIGSGYSGNQRMQTGDIVYQGPQVIGYVQGTNAPVVTGQDVTLHKDTRITPLNTQLKNNFNQNIQLQITIPIFNGLQARNGVRKAEINYQNQELTLKDTKDKLRQEIEQAYANAKASLNNYLAAKAAVKSTKEGFDYAQIKFNEQMINSVDYDDAKTKYENARLQMIQAKYEYVFRLKVLDLYQGKPISL